MNGDGEFLGRFLDGVTAASQEVTVTLERGGEEPGWASAGDEVVVGRRTAGYGDVVLRWPRARIARRRIDGARVTLSCADAEDALLEISTEAADQLLGAAPTRAGGEGERRSRWPTLALYAAGCAAVAAALYLGATPASRAIARRVPPRIAAQLGQGLQALIGKQYCESPAARASLDRLAARLTTAGERDQLALHVLDTPMVNAFTFPGGTVVVTRGLLAEAESADEVAGVLAHEIEHVARRHVLVHVVRSSLLTAIWQASVGDYSGFMVVDPKTALDIATLRFSRDDERDADRGALRRLNAAGISRVGFGRFFDRMREKTDAIPAWLSNHPASAERSAAIAAAPSATSSATTPALGAADWQALRDACDSGAPPTGRPAAASPGR